MTRADLLRTAEGLHDAYVRDGDLTHAEDFAACPERRCATLKAAVLMHTFSRYAPYGYHCETCGGAWDTLDEALTVPCVERRAA